jgi:RNA polymerase-binding transcription factor DksA
VLHESDASARLELARDRAVTRVEALAASLQAIVAASESANLDDEHDPEGSTVGFERAQVQALLDAARARLTELDAARERLDRGAYGICDTCGAAISSLRLEAQPAARTCVECAGAPASERRPA